MQNSTFYDSLCKIVAEYPNICAEGLRYPGFKHFDSSRELLLTPPFVEQFETAVQFLRFDCTPSPKNKYLSSGSYGLKHRAENWGRRHLFASYVSNGIMILAALSEGLAVWDAPEVGPNCIIGVYRRPSGWVRRGVASPNRKVPPPTFGLISAPL